ncbi:MAG: hypothetical protein COY19_02295 [Candidatus Marinimicrobia bacterium CG_4_10_14_0_2_um_filter_48_9]|nr:MAG: hypothetical protein COY19_02295 [Candidatus Marinimicrobia bacterium CG_4_10_14_0_2_um_filter_48_9]
MIVIKNDWKKVRLLIFIILTGVVFIPVRTFAAESRLPIQFSMVQYLQHSPNLSNYHIDLGFTAAMEISQLLDIGLAYRSYGGNYYYYANPGDQAGKLAERTLIYTNCGLVDIHPFRKTRAPYLRIAVGMAGVTEEQIVLSTTHYNYTWFPTAMVGMGVDIKAYKNVLIATQCEWIYLPYYKQDIITNPPWILQVGLGLTFR